MDFHRARLHNQLHGDIACMAALHASHLPVRIEEVKTGVVVIPDNLEWMNTS